MKVEISIEELINIYFKKALTQKKTLLKTAKNDRGHIEHIKMLNKSKVTEKIKTLLLKLIFCIFFVLVHTCTSSFSLALISLL